MGDAGHAFDLGCSLGATTLAVLKQNPSPDIRVTGVDSSAPMIEGASRVIDDPRARFIRQDLRDTDVSGANVVILNLVLQFLAPEERLDVLRNLRAHMATDGLLIVSEKVRHTDPALHELFDSTHLAWKKANGYTDLEIAQKRTALENVMQIDTEEAHQARFHAAGYRRVIQWYRCMNWASFLVYP